MEILVIIIAIVFIIGLSYNTNNTITEKPKCFIVQVEFVIVADSEEEAIEKIRVENNFSNNNITAKAL